MELRLARKDVSPRHWVDARYVIKILDFGGMGADGFCRRQMFGFAAHWLVARTADLLTLCCAANHVSDTPVLIGGWGHGCATAAWGLHFRRRLMIFVPEAPKLDPRFSFPSSIQCLRWSWARLCVACRVKSRHRLCFCRPRLIWRACLWLRVLQTNLCGFVIRRCCTAAAANSNIWCSHGFNSIFWSACKSCRRTTASTTLCSSGLDSLTMSC